MGDASQGISGEMIYGVSPNPSITELLHFSATVNS